MTAQEELTMWEAALTAFASTGVLSYSVAGRTVTRANMLDITKRVDQLRRQVAREAAGGTASVARFVDPE